MPSLPAAGARVDMKKLQRRVGLHFQNMGMAADKQMRGTLQDQRTDARSIVTGITAYMCYPYIHAFQGKTKVFGIADPEGRTIHVSANGPERFKAFQLIRHFGTSDIAGMPYFVYLIKITAHLRM